MDLQQNPVNEILYISFNQDFTCFVCGTETGFRVYSTDPFRLTYRRDFESGGGLGVICMLFRTNILAFAGGGKSPRFQPNKVVLWDDRQARVIAELSFKTPVKSVRLRRDLVVVALERKVYVYGLRSLSLFDSIETIENPKGLCCLSVGVERAVLVCPGMQKGRALVIFYPRAFGDSSAPPERQRTTIISAHESVIASMATDSNGSLLATASDRGTIVRVYDTSTGSRLQELRRGADRAEIHSLVFSQHGDWLAIASDKGTVHVFAIQRPGGPASSPSMTAMASVRSESDSPPAAGYPANRQSSLHRLSRVLPSYFASEWSLAQFRVPDFRCAAAFGADPYTVVIVCANGSYYKARFDPQRGGEMVREEFAQFDDANAEPNPVASRVTSAMPVAAPATSPAASSAPAPADATAAASAAAHSPQASATPEGAAAEYGDDDVEPQAAADALVAASFSGPIMRNDSNAGDTADDSADS